VREVVGALINSYWAHGQLEVPEIKWVQTNNYKFHTFCSVHFNPSLSPRPSFRFPEGLVPRLGRGGDRGGGGDGAEEEKERKGEGVGGERGKGGGMGGGGGESGACRYMCMYVKIGYKLTQRVH